MERPNLQLIDVEEEEAWVNSIENTFNKITEENFLKEGGTIKVQVCRTPDRQDQKRNSP